MQELVLFPEPSWVSILGGPTLGATLSWQYRTEDAALCLGSLLVGGEFTSDRVKWSPNHQGLGRNKLFVGSASSSDVRQVGWKSLGSGFTHYSSVRQAAAIEGSTARRGTLSSQRETEQPEGQGNHTLFMTREQVLEIRAQVQHRLSYLHAAVLGVSLQQLSKEHTGTAFLLSILVLVEAMKVAAGWEGADLQEGLVDMHLVNTLLEEFGWHVDQHSELEALSASERDHAVIERSVATLLSDTPSIMHVAGCDKPIEYPRPGCFVNFPGYAFHRSGRAPQPENSAPSPKWIWKAVGFFRKCGGWADWTPAALQIDEQEGPTKTTKRC